MMEAFVERIKNIGVPIRYQVFKNKPNPPYMIYYDDDTDNFYADGIVYCRFVNYVVELYTDKEEPELEKQVEDILEELEISWRKENDYDETEKLIKTSYYFNLGGNADEG